MRYEAWYRHVVMELEGLLEIRNVDDRPGSESWLFSQPAQQGIVMKWSDCEFLSEPLGRDIGRRLSVLGSANLNEVDERGEFRILSIPVEVEIPLSSEERPWIPSFAEANFRKMIDGRNPRRPSGLTPTFGTHGSELR